MLLTGTYAFCSTVEIQLIQERNVERCSAAREHHEHIHLLRNEHKRELDVGQRLSVVIVYC